MEQVSSVKVSYYIICVVCLHYAPQSLHNEAASSPPSPLPSACTLVERSKTLNNPSGLQRMSYIHHVLFLVGLRNDFNVRCLF